MKFTDHDTISEEVREQLRSVCRIWTERLKAELAGIYLHGSLAMGCFSENASDLDLLIVTSCRLSREKRLAVAADILAADGSPCPLEMSAVYAGDLHPLQTPVPCQFHYSSCWTEHYRKLLSGELAESFLVDTDFTDPDVASYIRVINECGICLTGRPAAEVLPAVSDAEFLRSIADDIENYELVSDTQRDTANRILILCRILSYKAERRILTKYDGGKWAMAHVPPELSYIVEDAMRAWYEARPFVAASARDMERLRRLLIDAVKN